MPHHLASPDHSHPSPQPCSDEFGSAATSGPGKALSAGHSSIFLALAVLVAGVSAYVYYSVFGVKGSTVRAASSSHVSER